MKRALGIFGTLAVLAIYAALTYGFYLIHPGLGWIVGALLVLVNALRFTPEARARREAAEAVLVKRQEMKDRIDETIRTGRPPASDTRHRGIN